jgi:LemA protein
VAPWVLIGVPVLLTLAALRGYKNLLTLRHRIQDAWSPVEDHLRSRGDRVQRLIETLHGSTEREHELLRAVRTAFRQAREAESLPARAEAENELSEALRCLVVAMPACLEPGIRRWREELTAAEDQIAAARQSYNDQVMAWNVRIARLPWRLIAWRAGLHPAEYFVMDEPGRREAPPVVS